MNPARPPPFFLGLGKGAAPSSRPRMTVLRMPPPPPPPAAPLRVTYAAPPEPVVSALALGGLRGGTGGDHLGAPLRVPPPEPMVSALALGARGGGTGDDLTAPLVLALAAPGEEEYLGSLALGVEEEDVGALVLGEEEEGLDALVLGEEEEDDVAVQLCVTRAAHLPSPVEGEEDPAAWHGEWWVAVEASGLASSSPKAAAPGPAASSPPKAAAPSPAASPPPKAAAPGADASSPPPKAAPAASSPPNDINASPAVPRSPIDTVPAHMASAAAHNVAA